MEETKHNTEMNLFNDPQILAIKNSLPPEYLEELRIKGESMYKDIDFENETIIYHVKGFAGSFCHLPCVFKCASSFIHIITPMVEGRSNFVKHCTACSEGSMIEYPFHNVCRHLLIFFHLYS